jgi:hypothetical protein
MILFQFRLWISSFTKNKVISDSRSDVQVNLLFDVVIGHKKSRILDTTEKQFVI